MARYYFDLRDACFAVSDSVGEEHLSPQAASERVAQILSQVAGDLPLEQGCKSILASVRDEADRVVFTAALSIAGHWHDHPEPDAAGAHDRVAELLSMGASRPVAA
ncbi:DUF6894 family protein [Methylobacterium nigriterrae]|uniref:DUF6894 family protein n=1 Tax=Methylobacterium nigriterrae TaxID=3127512 RepID=UPI00301418A0